MEPFAQLFAPILAIWSDRFRSMPLGARVGMAGLLLTGTLAIAWSLSTTSTDTTVFLLQGETLTSAQLSTMESAFAKAGLNDYFVEQQRVRVPRDERHRYMASLADADVLPANFGDYFADAVKSASPLETHREKSERIKNARQRELSQIIQSMKGIETAMVLYDSHTEPGLRQKEILTASISIKPSRNGELIQEQVRTIRNLVASAIAGLQTDQIIVTDLNRGRSFASDDVPPPEMLARQLASRQLQSEKAWTAKIRDGLSWVPGLLVTVHVTMNRDSAALDRNQNPNGDWKPERVQVALGVPNEYLDKTWRKRYQLPAGHNAPTPPAEELQTLKTQIAIDLKSHVANLLPQPTGATHALQDVQLTFFENLSAPVAIDTPPASTSTPAWNPTLWSLVVVSLLGVFGILALRRANRPSPPTESGSESIDTLTTESAPLAAPLDLLPTPSVSTVREEVVSSTSTPRIDPAHSTPRALHSPTTELPSRPSVPRRPPPGRFIPSPQASGIEINDMTTARLATTSPDPVSHDRAPEAPAPFAFASLVGIEELTELLSQESAQIVAIVFSHLPVEQSADVLRRLPDSLRVDVIRRLSCLDEMHDDVIRDIVDGLESRLADQLRRMERKKTGMNAIQTILDAAGEETKQSVLKKLRHHNVGLYRQIDPQAQMRPEPTRAGDRLLAPADRQASRVITFEDVIRLDDETLRTVMAATDPQVAIQALAGATQGVVDRLAQKMKPNEADRLRLALEQVSSASLHEVRESQQRVVGVATELQAAGRIQLRNATQGALPV